jgi:hypothetical protein
MFQVRVMGDGGPDLGTKTSDHINYKCVGCDCQCVWILCVFFVNKLRIIHLNQQSLKAKMFTGHLTLQLRMKYDKKKDFNTTHHYDSASYNPYTSDSYMVNSVSLFSQTHVRQLSATRLLSEKSPVYVINEQERSNVLNPNLTFHTTEMFDPNPDMER